MNTQRGIKNFTASGVAQEEEERKIKEAGKFPV